MSDIAIKVENLSKLYQLGEIGTGTISHDLNRWWARIRGKEDPFLKIGQTNDRATKGENNIVYSLRDINFEIKQGEAVGIIGRNGAGKSTLLKILSKVTAPTTGRANLKGRVASLLEVGTGFHPELTGRENIYLNGAILGMRKNEIARKLDEIIDFSGVERYVDTPVKRYSSGMYVRLAFAVAAHLESEILIVDEVLAVGDVEFQKKCLGKMGDMQKTDGRTVLFVSHNMGAISQLCSSGIFLKNGEIREVGEINSIINIYFSDQYTSNNEIIFNKIDSKGQILQAKLTDNNGIGCTDFPSGISPNLEIKYCIHEDVRNFQIAVILTDSIGNHIYSTADTDLAPDLLKARKAGVYTVKLKIPMEMLNVGSYNISIGMGIVNTEIFHRSEMFRINILDTGDFGTGKEGKRRLGLLLIMNQWDYV